MSPVQTRRALLEIAWKVWDDGPQGQSKARLLKFAGPGKPADRKGAVLQARHPHRTAHANSTGRMATLSGSVISRSWKLETENPSPPPLSNFLSS